MDSAMIAAAGKLLASLPALVVLIGRDGTARWVNGAWREMARENPSLGPHDAVGLSYTEICRILHGGAPEDVRPAIEGIRGVMAGEIERFEFECPLRRADEERWLRLVASPVADETHRGALLMLFDVTEHRRADQALAKSEQSYRILFEASPDGIGQASLDCKLTVCNEHCARMGGYESSAELIGRDLMEVFAPEDRERALADFRKTTESGEVSTGAYTLLRKDGSRFLGEISAAAIYDAQRQPAAVMAVIRDITERHRAEAALLQTSRMQTAATLAGGIAHDFNNLMVVVLGHAELLRLQLAAQPEARNGLLEISQAAQRGGELAQQLLAFAQGGKYHPQRLNLNGVIERALRLQQRAFPSRVRIEQDLSPSLREIQADPAQMEQVLMNLCVNAVEAIRGNGRITIATRNLDLDLEFATAHPNLQPGPHVLLTVEDSGCGMDSETAARVFEPFFSTKFTGRGLGLAAVYGIVTNHAGHVSVHSEKGRGAAFEIYLPALAEAAPSAPPPPEAAAAAGETILVIDDEESVLNVTVDLLRQLGYQVLAVGGGAEAVDQAAHHSGRIHLAILDMGMPKMSGPETFALLHGAHPDMKILVCSGYDLDAAARSLLDAGASGFLQKPFRLRELAAAVRKALGDG